MSEEEYYEKQLDKLDAKLHIEINKNEELAAEIDKLRSVVKVKNEALVSAWDEIEAFKGGHTRGQQP